MLSFYINFNYAYKSEGPWNAVILTSRQHRRQQILCFLYSEKKMSVLYIFRQMYVNIHILKKKQTFSLVL